MSVWPRMSMVGSIINMELCQWNVPEHYIQRSNPQLIGKAYDTIEQLVAEVPSDEKRNKDIRLYYRVEAENGYKGFSVYASKFLSSEYPVAYGCNECSKIVVGTPKIEEMKRIVKGIRYSCNNCKKTMVEQEMGSMCSGFGHDDDDDDDHDF